MAILANRVKITNSLLELVRYFIVLRKRIFFTLLLITSCYFLYYSGPSFITNKILEFTGDILSSGSIIYKKSIQAPKWLYNRIYFLQNLEKEHIELKRKLNELQAVKMFAINIEAENTKLRKMLNVPKNIKYDFITAKIVGISMTPFVNAMTVQAGISDEINLNDIVTGKSGLIGRVSHLSENYATIMLINDHNSRIPVITENSKVKGILAKQGDNLKIIYLSNDHNAETGEKVYTSGDGTIYPKSIEVGVIEKVTNKGIFVQPMENFNKIEYVIIQKTSIKK